MHKIYLFFFLSVFAVAVAQADTQTDKKRERLVLKINYTLDQSTVLEYLKKCVSEINKGDKDGKDLSIRKYSSYVTILDMYSQHQWFVADTGLNMEWFNAVRKLMSYMYKTRDIIETAIHNHQTQTAKCKKAEEYFDVAYARFVKLVKKPVMVSSKVQRQARRQKVIWQKAMREKYKIKP